VLALTGAYMVVEAVAGWWTGSLALLADAGHMLTDVAGLALALLAIWFARRPPTPDKTYGYYRVEILAALVNAIVLLGVSILILYEAYRRLRAPEPIMATPMLVVAVVGLGVNVLGMIMLRAGSRESLNVKGAYLEVMSDALGSVGAIVAALVVLGTGWSGADAMVGGIIGLFIVPRTWRLLSQAVNVLLEGVPPHLSVAEIEQAMLAVAGVREVHDLHVWTLTSGRDAMSAHVFVSAPGESDRILRALHEVLHTRFGIEHTTIQMETQALVRIGAPSATRPEPGEG
jgi:cobalt-zinc-cadmium efflux system protein